VKKRWKISVLPIISIVLFACHQEDNKNSANSSSPTPGVTVAPSPAATAATTAGTGKFLFAGLDADKVSTGYNVVPDNNKDLHFTYSNKFTGEVILTDVIISRYEHGQPKQVAGWATGLTNSLYWVLAVEANGKALNTAKTAKLGKLSGDIRFDFYGSNVPGFGLAKTGTAYQLEITFRDASGKETKIAQKTTI
jgi:hypothetical protein